jgi:two-component system LytT family sensor kinase
MTAQQLRRARRRVRRLREFDVHLAIFVVAIGGIALLNWIVSPTFWWVVFPAIGWGIGLAAHAVSVFFEDSLLGSAWEERKTREIVEREQREMR